MGGACGTLLISSGQYVSRLFLVASTPFGDRRSIENSRSDVHYGVWLLRSSGTIG